MSRLIIYSVVLSVLQFIHADFVEIVDIFCHSVDRHISDDYMKSETGSICCRSSREVELQVYSSKAIIRDIVIPESNQPHTGPRINADQIEILYLYMPISLRTLPAGIKLKLLNLTSIIIYKGQLAHLEQGDMKQFGRDLIYADFTDNLLSALSSDVFENNPNLEFIKLAGNSLKFVDPALIVNLNAMKKLEQVIFEDAGCINVVYSSKEDVMEYFRDHPVICDDEFAENENAKLISERETFLIQFLPADDEEYEDQTEQNYSYEESPEMSEVDNTEKTTAKALGTFKSTSVDLSSAADSNADKWTIFVRLNLFVSLFYFLNSQLSLISDTNK